MYNFYKPFLSPNHVAGNFEHFVPVFYTWVFFLIIMHLTWMHVVGCRCSYCFTWRRNTLRWKRYVPSFTYMNSQIPTIDYCRIDWQGRRNILTFWSPGWLWHHQDLNSQSLDNRAIAFLLHHSRDCKWNFMIDGFIHVLRCRLMPNMSWLVENNWKSKKFPLNFFFYQTTHQAKRRIL